jgi:hypothetical protein
VKAAWCGGRFEVTIRNVALTERNGNYPSYADAMADQVSRDAACSGGCKAPVEPRYGFNEEFKAKGVLADRFFFERTPGTDFYDLVAECDTKSVMHFCKLHFSLGYERRIGVEVAYWPYERMQEAKDLHRRIEEFVTPMVQEPRCQESGPIKG